MAKDDKLLQMVVSMDVKGKEGLNLTLTYSDTDLATVMLVQKALVTALTSIVDAQIAEKG